MKKIFILIYGTLALIIIVPVIFYICFAIGMTSNSRPKEIKLAWVKLYKTAVKGQFSNVKDINIYYRFGMVNFDFTTNAEMSLDECKEVVKATKDFIVKETASNSLLDDKYIEQLNISVKFELKENKYVFECPYWIRNENNNVPPNDSEINNYKVWYLEKSNGVPEIMSF